MNKDNNREEITIIELFVIPFKYWKIVTLVFSILFLSGLMVFTVYSKRIAGNNESKPVTKNEISQGYVWVTNYVKAQMREYDDYSNVEIVNLLLKEGKINESLSVWPNLVCKGAGGKMIFSMNNQDIFTIEIEIDNSRKVITFITNKQDLQKAKLSKLSLNNDDVNQINNIVAGVFLKLANEKIYNYRKLRQMLSQSINILNNKANKNTEDAMLVTRLSEVFLSYNFIEKEYVQETFNVNSTITMQNEMGISFMKFAIVFFIISFFITLFLAYFLEFAKRSEMLAEIRRAFKK
ncbi:MAG: hypothetical protein OEV66_04455 [Spirochaetia bacterium]|nr:hypothetical protein [Spirochaetia bacterium]